jgi:hypothetical protein
VPVHRNCRRLVSLRKPTQSAGRRFNTRVAAVAAAAALMAAFCPGVAQAAPSVPASMKSRLLYNVQTGQCADVPGRGKGRVDGPVYQFPCRGTNRDNQLWNFLPQGKHRGKYNVYLIQNAKDGMCLDVPYYGKVPPATPITEYPCRKQDNQAFYMKPSPVRGYVFLVNLKSGLCLDVAGENATHNARLTLWHCDLNGDHLWALRSPRDPYHVTGSYIMDGWEKDYWFGREVAAGEAAARRYHIPPRLMAALLMQESPGAKRRSRVVYFQYKVLLEADAILHNRSLGIAKMKYGTARAVLRKAGRPEARWSTVRLVHKLVWDERFDVDLAALYLRQLIDSGFSEKGAYLAYALSPKAQLNLNRSIRTNSTLRARSVRYNTYYNYWPTPPPMPTPTPRPGPPPRPPGR